MTNEMRHHDIWNIIMMTHLMVTDGLLNFGSTEVCSWSIIERYEMLSTVGTNAIAQAPILQMYRVSL
jgi:hypothetical protein